MSVNEQNVTGRKYRVWDAANNIWKRLSFWTKASDVEMNDGTTLEATISEINSDITKLDSDTSWYGTCSTGASTVAKVATTTDSKFTLVTGAKVKVKFTYANTVSAPTLNVDSKGAKDIKAYGTTAPTVWWKAGDVVDFTYNGTNWIMGATCGQIEQIDSDLSAIKIDPLKVKVKYSDRYTVFTYGRSVLLNTFTSDNYLYVLPYTILENTSITLAVTRFDETGLSIQITNSSSSNVDVPIFLLYQEK